MIRSAVDGHYLADGAELVVSIRRHDPELAILFCYAAHEREAEVSARPPWAACAADVCTQFMG